MYRVHVFSSIIKGELTIEVRDLKHYLYFLQIITDIKIHIKHYIINHS
jgi:hypothetical protein